ncbi:MAG: bifunctional hydroxymethylpyrimidine kinase/phosphomethylpyrimidine kinase, partial [Clostridiales bacterium]|nr:bifunctional hydroxymethylpyrimidine kinase/phosphomethylpyrimidine kinase [Clostridiales bacterium]
YELKPMHIKADIFDSYDYLLAQLETPVETIEEAFKEAKNRVLFTVLNPAPAQKLSKELISNIDLLVPNETEFELLTNQPANDDGIIKGAEYLFSLGLKALMITLGKEGVYYLDSNNKFYRSKAYDVEVVDTTAAGDSFIGGFMTEISKGETIESAIEFAMIAGAITITRLGAQSSLPDIALLEKFKGKKELDNFQKNDC